MAIANRFTVLSLIEDLTLDSNATSETQSGEAEARARAIKHLPSLATTLGPNWAANEVGPFLQHCVRMDDAEVVTEIARRLPKLVAAFGAVELAPVVVGLASSSCAACRDAVRDCAPAAFCTVTSAGSSLNKNPSTVTGGDGLPMPLEVYVDQVVAPLSCAQSPYPGGRSVGLVLAASPFASLAAMAALSSSSAPRITKASLTKGDAVIRAGLKELQRVVRNQAAVEMQLQWPLFAAVPAAAVSTAARLLLALALSSKGDPAVAHAAVCRRAGPAYSRNSSSNEAVPAAATSAALTITTPYRVPWDALHEHAVTNLRMLPPSPKQLRHDVSTDPATRDRAVAAAAAAEAEVGNAAATLSLLVDAFVDATLASPVPWAIEVALLQAAPLLDLLRDIAETSGASSAAPVGKGGNASRANLIVLVTDCARRVADGVTGLATNVDFRVRLLLARHMASVVESGVSFSRLLRLNEQPQQGGGAAPSGSAGLFDDVIETSIRGVAQDPVGEVRCEAAKCITALVTSAVSSLNNTGDQQQPRRTSSSVLRRPDHDGGGLDGHRVGELLALCDQLRLDPEGYTREAVATAVGLLARGAHDVLDERDRRALYLILIDLLRDEAANVRLAAAVALGDCVALVGAATVERDLCEAARPLLAPTGTQWRAREQLVRGFPSVLEHFILPFPAAAAAANEPQPAGSSVPVVSRNLFDSNAAPAAVASGGVEKAAADDGGGGFERIARRSPADSPMLELLSVMLLDSAKAVREAALEAVCEAAVRITRRGSRGEIGAVHFEAIGIQPHDLPGIFEGDTVSVSLTRGADMAIAMLHHGLWPVIRVSPAAQKHYLLRVALLRVAIAIGLPFATHLQPLLLTLAEDPVANVRRAVGQALTTLLRRRPASSAAAASSTAALLATLVAGGGSANAAAEMFSGALVVVDAAARVGPVLELARRLVEDPSVDVREAAAEALALCH